MIDRVTEWKCEIASLLGDREEQQDAHAVFHNALGDFFVLSDGLGGHSGGREASVSAIAAIAQLLTDSIEHGDIWSDLGQAANDAVKTVREQQLFAKAACTLAILRLHGTAATFATIGDTRIHCLDGSNQLQTSRDDTVAQMLVERGDILPSELSAHPDRNRLTRSLGSSLFKGFEIREFTLTDSVGFLLATDGFWENTSASEITDLISSRRGNIRYAVAEAVRRASPNADNTTAILVTRADVSTPQSL